MKKTLTYAELIDLAKAHYNQGGDGIAECWDEDTYEAYGPMTMQEALSLIGLYHEDDTNCGLAESDEDEEPQEITEETAAAIADYAHTVSKVIVIRDSHGDHRRPSSPREQQIIKDAIHEALLLIAGGEDIRTIADAAETEAMHRLNPRLSWQNIDDPHCNTYLTVYRPILAWAEYHINNSRGC